MNFNQLFQKMRELDAPVSEELVGGQKKLDVDHDGDIQGDDLADLRAGKKEVDECGPMGMPDMPRPAPQQDSVNMNVSMNGSGANGIRDLMDLLRHLEQNGEGHKGGEPIEIEMEPMFGAEMDEEQLANAPDEKYAPMSRMTATGDDLHSAGDEAPKVNGGGNPMEALKAKLQELYDTMTLDEMGGGAGQSKPAPVPADPAKIQAEIDRFSKSNDMNLAANKQYVAGLQAKLGTTATKPADGRMNAATDPRSLTSADGGKAAAAAAAKTAPTTATKPAAPAGAPKVAYEKDFPAATATELQKKLNAAGEKLTVDGKMGPATRAAMARHPEITTDPNAPQNQPAAATATKPAETPAAPAAPAAPAPLKAANTGSDSEDDAKEFDPTWGGTKAAPDTRTTMQKILPNFAGGQSAPVAANQNATWNNAQQAAVSNAPASTTATKPAAAAAPQTSMDDSDDANAKPFVPPTATAAAPAASPYSLAPKAGGPGLKMPTAESAELTAMLRIAGLR